MYKFDLNKSYWANCGAEQATYDRLYEALVPADGDCETIEGELLRAISKVYYDRYNNGFGNDMRGPVAFLMEHHSDFLFRIFYERLAEAAPENRDWSGLSNKTLEDLVTSVIRAVEAKQGSYTALVGGGMWDRKYYSRIEEPRDEEDDYEEEEDDEDYG